MTAIDRLIEGIRNTGNPTCAGLDTQVSHLPDALRPKSGASPEVQAAAVYSYNEALMDALVGIVPSIKVQVAYYELLGLPGMETFAKTLRRAKQAGFTVIADAKRNDIGATSEAYAGAYLPAGAPFEADFITLNPYLGEDGVKPFLTACQTHGKGAFLLVKTSNAGSGQLQDRKLEDGNTIYETVAALVEKWGEPMVGENGYSSIGAVVGATHPQQGIELRKRFPRLFFLVPGYGAQGGTASDLRGCFAEGGMGGVVNASRSILTAWQKKPELSFAEAARQEALRMRDELQTALGIGK